MIETNQITAIANSSAAANLGGEFGGRALIEPTVNSAGVDALRITLVVAPGAIEKIKGSTLVRTIAQIKSELLKAGEERPAIFSYSTEAELANGGAE